MMKNHTLEQRAQFYRDTFPDWQASWPIVKGRWLMAVWIMGNNYRGTQLYGSYPPNYLKRVQSMFPDAERILHLFSGSLPPGPYTRFDIDPSRSDIAGDAEHLSDHLNNRRFDLILADPPYSAEDALHYGTCMIHRNKVMDECYKVLEEGGYIVWLDQVLPMFSKKKLDWCGEIGIVRSTNHRFRMASIFSKR